MDMTIDMIEHVLPEIFIDKETHYTNKYCSNNYKMINYLGCIKFSTYRYCDNFITIFHRRFSIDVDPLSGW
jgi:hypothetical protein